MNIFYRHAKMKLAGIGLLLLSGGALASCNEDNTIGVDPYAGGREPILVKLLDKKPNPASAEASAEVQFYASGLAKYCHPEENRYDFEFYISDEKAEVLDANDSIVTIRVPENVSSGLTYMVIQNQIFYGPNFKVLGSVSVDEGFSYYKQNGKLTGPSRGGIYGLLPWKGNNELLSRFYLAGDFRKSSSTKEKMGGLAMVTNNNGLSNYNTDYFKAKNIFYMMYSSISNPDGSYTSVRTKVNGLTYLKDEEKDPGVLVYGSFYEFEKENGAERPYSNLLLLKNDFSREMTTYTVQTANGESTSKTFHTFVGGTSGEIIRAWGTKDGKIVAVGNFNEHKQLDFEKSFWLNNVSELEGDFKLSYSPTITRMDKTGVYDSLYRKGAQYTGAVGTIADACQMENDDIVLVGDFTSFDGKGVSNVVKVKADGTIDEDFMNRIGNGADGPVLQVSYFKANDREYIVLTGRFRTLNGKECDGLAVLNGDGSFDPDFKMRGFEGGFPNFAKIVDVNGHPKMVVSGTFNKYDGIVRRGFLVLELTGQSIQGFNVSGQFSGKIYDAAYSLTSDNMNGILLVGAFDYFDGQPANSVVLLKIEELN